MFFLLSSLVFSVNVCIYIGSESECEAGVEYSKKYKLDQLQSSDYATLKSQAPINISYIGHESGDESHDDAELYIYNAFNGEEIEINISAHQSDINSKTLKYFSHKQSQSDNGHYLTIKFRGYNINFVTDTISSHNYEFRECVIPSPKNFYFCTVSGLKCTAKFLASLFAYTDPKEHSLSLYTNDLYILRPDDFNAPALDSAQIKNNVLTVGYIYQNDFCDEYPITVQDGADDTHFNIVTNNIISNYALTISIEINTIYYVTFRFGYSDESHANNIVEFKATKDLQFNRQRDILFYIEGCSPDFNIKLKYSTTSIINQEKYATQINCYNIKDQDKTESAGLIIQNGQTQLTNIDLSLNHNTIIKTSQSECSFRKLIISNTCNIDFQSTLDNNQGVNIRFTEYSSVYNGYDAYFLGRKGITISFQTLGDNSVNNQECKLHPTVSKVAETMQCPMVQIDAIKTEGQSYDQNKNLLVVIAYAFGNIKQFTSEEVSNLFTGDFSFFSTVNKQKKIAVQEVDNSYFTGFYARQSILKIQYDADRSQWSGTYDASLYSGLSHIFCFGLISNKDQCGNGIRITYDDQLEDKGHGEYKAKDKTYINKIINNIFAILPDDVKDVKFTYLITNYAYDNYEFNVPELDCSKLGQFSFEIASASHFTYAPKFGLINIDKGRQDATLILRNLKFTITKFLPSFKLEFISCNFESISDGKLEMNENVKLIHDYSDILYIAQGPKEMQLNSASLLIRNIQPLHMYKIIYLPLQLKFQFRSSPVSNIKPFDMVIECKQIEFVIEYTQDQPCFNIIENERLNFVFDIPETSGDSTSIRSSYPVVIFNNFNGTASAISHNFDWPDIFRDTENPLIKLLNTGISDYNKEYSFIDVILYNFSAPYFGFKDAGKYVASNELISEMKGDFTNFKLGDPSSTVKIDEISFDTHFLGMNKVGITGCFALIDNLEVKFDTVAEIPSFSVKKSLTVYPNATIRNFVTNQASRRLLKDENPTEQPDNGGAVGVLNCDIFGEKTILRWNSDFWPQIIFEETCAINRVINIEFKYDDTLLAQTINVTGFKEHFVEAKQSILQNIGFTELSYGKTRVNCF